MFNLVGFPGCLPRGCPIDALTPGWGPPGPVGAPPCPQQPDAVPSFIRISLAADTVSESGKN